MGVNRSVVHVISFAAAGFISVALTSVETKVTQGAGRVSTELGVTAVLLSTSEGPLETSGPTGALMATPGLDETVYTVNAITGQTDPHESGAGRSAYRTSAETSGPLAVMSDGYFAYVDAGSHVVVGDRRTGSVRKYDTPPPSSLALLSNGNTVVASPIGSRFLHMYNRTGGWLRSFGYIRKDERFERAENLFLHKGKVVVDAADNIYYVYHYLPIIQKFRPTGELEREIEVRGDSVDIQQQVARRFFATRKRGKVGGVAIINSAAVDRRTGHLWVCLNGSSTSGVIYEYNASGEKVREYFLQVSSSFAPPEVITAVRDIALTPTKLYAVTNLYQVFSFTRTGPGQGTTVSQHYPSASYPVIRVAWGSGVAHPSPRRAQGTCGNAQEWAGCTFNCPGPVCIGTTPTLTSSNSEILDCKNDLENSLSPPYVVIQSNCTQYTPGTAMHTRGGCNATVTICKNGVNTNHSVTRDCVAPDCSGAGEECDEQERQDCLNQWTWSWNEETCTCECLEMNGCFTPVLLDVVGNGFRLTNVVGGVDYDLNGDGLVEKVAWTAPRSDDAWLALDRNGNGRIDDGTELFGNFTPQPPVENPNGFLALAEYDRPQNGGNSDGVISVQDVIFRSLRLWQDTNHNGVSEPAELRGLGQLGLVAIELDYRQSRRRDQHGNVFFLRAKVHDSRGATFGRWAFDVFLVSAG